MKAVGIYWPGDYRAKPNEWARPQITESTRQLHRAPAEGRGDVPSGDLRSRRLGQGGDPVNAPPFWSQA